MDVEYYLLGLALFLITSFIGKRLRYMKSTFLIPSASDFALAAAVLSLLLLGKVSIVVLLLAALLVSIVLSKTKGSQVLYLKIVAYTTVLLSLPYLSYDTYEYARSLVTGFIFVTPPLLTLTALSIAISIMIALFDFNLKASMFDLEFASFIGSYPRIWLSLLSFASIVLGFAMTFAYGFLLAHVIALSAAEARALALVLYALLSALLMIFVPAPLASSLAAAVAVGVEMLLLRKIGETKVREVWKARMRLPLPALPGMRQRAVQGM